MRTADLKATARSQDLRAALTGPERKLWHRLRDRRLAGFKFVRQMSIGPYFADFACREAKLIIEVDGGQHAQSAHDEKRDAYLLQEGYRVLRFWNGDVNKNILNVCETIIAALDGNLLPYDQYKIAAPSLLPVQRGEGGTR